VITLPTELEAASVGGLVVLFGQDFLVEFELLNQPLDLLHANLYVGFYDLCRVHESLRSTPAMALGIADRVWTVGDLLDAALATQPIEPVTSAPDRRKRFRVIEGGKAD
jgi:hypothetical protein